MRENCAVGEGFDNYEDEKDLDQLVLCLLVTVRRNDEEVLIILGVVTVSWLKSLSGEDSVELPGQAEDFCKWIDVFAVDCTDDRKDIPPILCSAVMSLSERDRMLDGRSRSV